MRYKPEHKAAIGQKIVQDASRRVRAEGLTGAAVSTVMRDAGLTHGGFYKHFGNKEELLIESLSESFREIADSLIHAAGQSKAGTAWKAIVKAYLSPEHCDHAECGCPLAALAPELARADDATKARISEDLTKYKSRMLPFMPGRRAADKERAFIVIFPRCSGPLQSLAYCQIQRRAQECSQAHEISSCAAFDSSVKASGEPSVIPAQIGVEWRSATTGGHRRRRRRRAERGP